MPLSGEQVLPQSYVVSLHAVHVRERLDVRRERRVVAGGRGGRRRDRLLLRGDEADEASDSERTHHVGLRFEQISGLARFCIWDFLFNILLSTLLGDQYSCPVNPKRIIPVGSAGVTLEH